MRKCAYKGMYFVSNMKCIILMKEYKIVVIGTGGLCMVLDKINIGMRIRKVIEENYHETRQIFAERCGISENHLGKLEYGSLMISIVTLNKICTASGANPNYILYGECENKNLKIRKTIDNFLDNSNKQELKMYFKFISTIKSYLNTEK